MRRYLMIIAIASHVTVLLTAGAGWSQSENTIIVGWGHTGYGMINVPPPNKGFVAVAGCEYHSLGLKSDGTIVAWGGNQWGQCDVPPPNEDFVAIAGGQYHSFGLKSDGTIVAWGYNEDGQCDLPSPNEDFVALASGCRHGLGLKSDGTIVGWGRNGQGECNVPLPNEDFVAIAAGCHHSFGLKSDGTLVAWGWNNRGQTDVPLPHEGFVSVSGGVRHSLGVRSDGTIVTWGGDSHGLDEVPPPNEGFTAVEAGHYHSVGLKSDGTVAAWGWNEDRQCDVPSPNEGFIAVVGGVWHNLGLRRLGPSPGIIDISDVDNDQGRQVKIKWVRSSYDAPGDTVSISGYGIYRRQEMYMSAPAVNAVMPSENPRIPTTPQLDGWECVATVPAQEILEYELIVPTLCDSTVLAGTCWSAFIVSAVTLDSLVHYNSAPDSGYSIDNLAPNTPHGLTGRYDYPPDRLSLWWRRNIEADLSGYRLYVERGLWFRPSEANLVATTSDTIVTGLPYLPVYPWYAKVSAVDINGNESLNDVLALDFVTVPTVVTCYAAVWRNNAVEVSWVLADAGENLGVQVFRKKGDNGEYRDLPCEILGNDNRRYFIDRSTEPGNTYFYRVTLLEDGVPVASFEETTTTPAVRFALSQNKPNPFNPSTTIDFSVAENGPVSLRIYDISGRFVTTLVNRVMPPGAHSTEWDGRDSRGISVASGVYFYRLSAGGGTLTRKMALLK